MEYCITVFVETFEPEPDLRPSQPLQTAWGPAWRPDDEGRYFWEGGLHIRRAPPAPFLAERLPLSLQRVDWQVFDIGGFEGLADFEACVNRTDEEQSSADLRRHPLLSLLDELLKGQRKWAVFFLFDCDDIASDDRRPLGDLPRIVIEAYRWGSDKPRGFCCYDGE